MRRTEHSIESVEPWGFEKEPGWSRKRIIPSPASINSCTCFALCRSISVKAALLLALIRLQPTRTKGQDSRSASSPNLLVKNPISTMWIIMSLEVGVTCSVNNRRSYRYYRATSQLRSGTLGIANRYSNHRPFTGQLNSAEYHQRLLGISDEERGGGGYGNKWGVPDSPGASKGYQLVGQDYYLCTSMLLSRTADPLTHSIPPFFVTYLTL